MGSGARLRGSLLAALLIVSLYLPMLGAGFDFVDDGNLVYPAAPMSLAARAGLTWIHVVANWRDLGPFRPMRWAHWDLQAELLAGDPLAWRVWRLAWSAFAAAALLWLFAALRIGVLAAALATALTMWAPAPNEIGRSLTLSEGVAMPFRAPRSSTNRNRHGGSGWCIAPVRTDSLLRAHSASRRRCVVMAGGHPRPHRARRRSRR